MAKTRVPILGFWYLLQLFGAGLFVFICLCAIVIALPEKTPAWLMPPVMVVAFFAAIIAAMAIFRGKLPSRRTAEEIQAERDTLDKAGQLSHESFRALRAFQVDEFEDEGSHYFLELEDKTVLYLSGQFLYEYEPAETRKGMRPRKFPCTEFTLRRFKEGGYVADILCSGEILEPEITVDPLSENDYKTIDWISEEVFILRDRTYDQIKAERLAETRRRR